jgi:catechol 2,3-dioxygenase-like lactoylglutathione lyase family enzyme
MNIVTVFVSDLVSAHDFYCKKLGFISSVNSKLLYEKKILYFYAYPTDVKLTTYIRIQLSPAKTRLHLSDDNRKIEMKNIFIEDMHSKITDVIPEYSENDFPPGSISTLKKSNHGTYFNIKDPFGNFLIFCQ